MSEETNEPTPPSPAVKDFENWWASVGSSVRPLPGDDFEEHSKRIAAIAWHSAVVHTANKVLGDRS